MPCAGCQRRKEWLLRMASKAAQAVAVRMPTVVGAKKKDTPKES